MTEIMTDEEMNAIYSECNNICVKITKEIQKMLIKECNKSTTVKNQTLLYQGLVYDKIAVFLCAAAFNIYKEVVVNGDEIIPSEYLINFTDKVLSRADEMLWEKVELNNVN